VGVPYPNPLPPHLHDALLAAGPGPERGGPETVLCIHCGHSARSHPDSSSCSHRGRWWRRCRCSGYTGFDSTDRP
jgi:hypothetical protein